MQPVGVKVTIRGGGELLLDAVVQTRCACVAADAREDARRGVGCPLQALVSGHGP